MAHIVASISGHGYGHIAQTAPVLNRLAATMPQLRVTVRSTTPAAQLRSRIRAPFTHLGSEGDIGMAMSSALDVRIEDSCSLYSRFHADWHARVRAESNLLHDIKADLVLSNVGYLPLAGAQNAGIPNVALCSLNWFDIYRHYCGDNTIAAQINECYRGADVFFRATPGMTMPYLPNLVEVAPIVDIGRHRRDELNRHLRLSSDEKLVLVSMGGINSRFPMERWPRLDGVRWLVQADWKVRHPDAIELESLPLEFRDLVASSDALLCKPGYGAFTEAVFSGTPVLYVPRPDWPESPDLVDWLQRFGVCCEVPRQALETGDIALALDRLWGRRQPCVPHGKPETLHAVGDRQVAEWLLGVIDR
jgi:hypothetical protein